MSSGAQNAFLRRLRHEEISRNLRHRDLDTECAQQILLEYGLYFLGHRKQLPYPIYAGSCDVAAPHRVKAILDEQTRVFDWKVAAVDEEGKQYGISARPQ